MGAHKSALTDAGEEGSRLGLIGDDVEDPPALCMLAPIRLLFCTHFGEDPLLGR